MELEALEKKVRQLEAENERLEAAVAAAEAAAGRADAYRQVSNAQAGHNWGYYQHLHKEELDRYWAQTTDDIVYAHGQEAFYGRESVYQYYIETPRSMCARGRENAEKNFGLTVPAPDGPGYRVHNVIGSPVVEIAADGKTARGIWMAHTFMSQIDENGNASPSFGLAKYGDEFFQENGVWKMWHRRDYVDGMLSCDILPNLPFENNHPEDPADPGIWTLKQAGDLIYHPYSCTRREPPIPQPYETWTESQSCVAPLHPGYDGEQERRETHVHL